MYGARRSARTRTYRSSRACVRVRVSVRVRVKRIPAAIMRMSEPTSIIVLAVLACARCPSSYMRRGVVVIQSMYRAMGTRVPATVDVRGCNRYATVGASGCNRACFGRQPNVLAAATTCTCYMCMHMCMWMRTHAHAHVHVDPYMHMPRACACACACLVHVHVHVVGAAAALYVRGERCR